MPRGDRVVRQWRFLQLVSRPAGLTLGAAARELGCTVRTVWRDLRALQDAGFPLSDERADERRRGVWKVEATFQNRPPIPVGLDEAVALLVSQKLMAAAGLSPLGPAIASLGEKFRALLTPRALELIDRMAARVAVRTLGAKLQSQAAEYLPVIQRALSEHRAVRVTYHSMSRAADTHRRVDPYHLMYFHGGLYLIGYCHLRQAVRIFAVERVRTLELLEATFAILADFDAEAYLATAWSFVRGDLVTVTVVFSATVAPYVRERLWHPSQELRDLPDGRLEMTLRVADTIEVRRWLLGFTADAEVIAPTSLREALRVEAERLAALLARPPEARVQHRGSGKPLARVVPERPASARRRRPA